MTRAHRFPLLRWAALAWLAVWLPFYAQAYGAWHFLFLCNLGVLLTVAGIVFDRPLLLSSQLLMAPLIAALFALDLGARLATGQFLHAGTAFLWDDSLPLAVRLLSLYHLAWPLVLAWCVLRAGYDRRAFALQCLLGVVAVAAGLWLAPASENLNYVAHWPGSAEPHARPVLLSALSLAALAAVAWWPLHRWLSQRFPAPALAYSSPTEPGGDAC